MDQNEAFLDKLKAATQKVVFVFLTLRILMPCCAAAVVGSITASERVDVHCVVRGR